MTTDDSNETCEGCGLQIEGGTSGCQAFFEELLARDFSDAQRFGVHRMMVDVYSLQHPERYCKSAKSLAAHLVSLCAILESGANPAIGEEHLRNWLDGPSPVTRPEVPSDRGKLTIAILRDTESPEAHATAVKQWAESTWKAYEPLHSLAREWLDRSRTESPSTRHGA